MERYSILCIDDEPNVLDGLRRLLQREYDVSVAESPEAAFQILKEKQIDLVICDQRMPGMTGIELLKKIREEHPDTMRFLLTGHADVDVAIDAINEGGVHRFITKPCKEQELRLILRDAFEGYRLRMENRLLTQNLARRCRELTRRNEQLKERNEYISKLNEELRIAKEELQKKVQQIDALLFEAERRASRTTARL
jgi:DNA-binding NtrC family response regulator